MIAADTNVLVRLLTNDDARQSPRAAEVFSSEDVFIAKTVLLETEWVLRAAYGLSPASIGAAFARLASTASVSLEDAGAVAHALSWYGAGMDFADAVHLASAASASAFVTFDRPLARRAKAAKGAPPVTLL